MRGVQPLSRGQRLAWLLIGVGAVALVVWLVHQVAIGNGPLSRGVADAGRQALAARLAQPDTPQLGRVVRWIDGDTLTVVSKLRDVETGDERTTDTYPVRLLGVGAPETHRGVQCGGAEAARLAARLLPPGSRVRVLTDRSSGDTVDRYWRRLAYVETLERSDRDIGEALLRAGRATVYRYYGRRFTRLERYRRAERAARAARRGSWRECPHFSASSDGGASP